MLVSKAYVMEVRNAIKKVKEYKFELGKLYDPMDGKALGKMRLDVDDAVSKLNMADIADRIGVDKVLELGKRLGLTEDNAHHIQYVADTLDEYFAKLGNDVINDMPTLFDTGGVKGWSDNLVMALAVLIRKTKMASISKFRTDIGGKASFYIEIRHGERNATWALSNATTQMAYDLLDLTDLMDRRVHDSRGKIDHNVFMSIIHTVVKEYKSKGGNENE